MGGRFRKISTFDTMRHRRIAFTDTGNVKKFLAPCLLAALAVAPLASAAPPPGSQAAPAPQTGADSVAVSDADLSRFVAAYRAVIRIRKKLMIRMHGVTDEKKIETGDKQAEQEMRKEIRSRMTLEQYVRIGKAVNADKALRARFMQMMDAAPEAPPAATG